MKYQTIYHKWVIMALILIAAVLAAGPALCAQPIDVKKADLTTDDLNQLFEGRFGNLNRIDVSHREVVIDDGLFYLAPKASFYMIDKGRVKKVEGKKIKAGFTVGIQLDRSKQISALYMITKVTPKK